MERFTVGECFQPEIGGGKNDRSTFAREGTRQHPNVLAGSRAGHPFPCCEAMADAFKIGLDQMLGRAQVGEQSHVQRGFTHHNISTRVAAAGGARQTGRTIKRPINYRRCHDDWLETSPPRAVKRACSSVEPAGDSKCSNVVEFSCARACCRVQHNLLNGRTYSVPRVSVET